MVPCLGDPLGDDMFQSGRRQVDRRMPIGVSMFDDHGAEMPEDGFDSTNHVDSAAWSVLVQHPDRYAGNASSESADGRFNPTRDIFPQRLGWRLPDSIDLDRHDGNPPL
jgi:hypothetical protein